MLSSMSSSSSMTRILAIYSISSIQILSTNTGRSQEGQAGGKAFRLESDKQQSGGQRHAQRDLRLIGDFHPSTSTIAGDPETGNQRNTEAIIEPIRSALKRMWKKVDSDGTLIGTVHGVGVILE